MTSREYYNTKIINDVIYNENTHIVSVFKDFLIFDDVSEFLKRQYDISECKKRMPKVIEFYETYSKVFPNYVNLPENKFMFKNIERKQLYWDSKQHFLMEQEERNTKKKAKIEDFGGVQNAPSSFFNESMDDKLFSNSWIKNVNDMSTLTDNEKSFFKIVTVKDEYDSRVIDLADIKPKPNTAAEQLGNLITSFANKDTSTVYSQSRLDLTGLSHHLNDESFASKLNDPDVSNFFKKSDLDMKKKQNEARNRQMNSKLMQYNENLKDNAIQMISNHYNDKARKDRKQHANYEKSTVPSTDNRIIVSSETLDRNTIRNRDSSEKKATKIAPFGFIAEKKCTSQYSLKPKLKIVKNKESKQSLKKK